MNSDLENGEMIGICAAPESGDRKPGHHVSVPRSLGLSQALDDARC